MIGCEPTEKSIKEKVCEFAVVLTLSHEQHHRGSSTFRQHTHHLRHAKTMSKIVKRNIIVMLVDLIEPFLQSAGWNSKLFDEVQLDEHYLHELENLVVLELIWIKSWQSKCAENVLAKCRVAHVHEGFLHVRMLWQTRFPLWWWVWPIR